MKKFSLALMAVIIGAGMAFANAGNIQQAVYYNDAPFGQPTHWVPIPSGKTVDCDNASRDCTADENMNLLDTGNGTLVDI